MKKKVDITGGYDGDMLKQMKEKNIVYTGPPPSNKKFSAQAWKDGMQFVYLTSGGKQILHWYHCNICGRFINTNLSNGTATVRTHILAHKKGQKYTFKADDLKILLALATKYGKRVGSRNAEDFILPPSAAWNLDFLKNMPSTSKHQLQKSSKQLRYLVLNDDNDPKMLF